MKFNRTTFWSYAKRAPFGGHLKTSQVDGTNKILDYWETSGLTDTRWLAYMLATVFHETAATMQPIEEYHGKTARYAPYYGRGLVQLTWEDNYKKYGIAETPAKALEWPTALHIMFHGMQNGVFTGKRLSQFFNKKADDPVGARKIINGADKQHLIAGYHKAFLGALEAADVDTPQPTDVSHEQAQPSDIKPVDSGWLGTIISMLLSGGGLSAFSAINTGWAAGVVSLVVLLVGGLFVWLVWSGRISFNRLETQGSRRSSVDPSVPVVDSEPKETGESGGTKGSSGPSQEGK